jgi:hypothetical protein
MAEEVRRDAPRDAMANLSTMAGVRWVVRPHSSPLRGGDEVYSGWNRRVRQEKANSPAWRTRRSRREVFRSWALGRRLASEGGPRERLPTSKLLGVGGAWSGTASPYLFVREILYVISVR